MPELKKNVAQEEAIKTINGPLIIISCPGSGKTTTLLRRIHNMVQNGISPENILMVTFTKAAADDMKTRYKAMYQAEDAVTFATIHAFCLAVLRKEGLRQPGDILSEQEKMDFFLNKTRHIQGVEEPFDLSLDVSREVGTVKNSYLNINTYEPESCDKEIFVYLYQAYEEYKRTIGKIDYEDLMIECEKLFRDKPEVLKKYSDRFQYIQCDEYQDTNLIQKNILYLLAGERKNLCVVGDDDQSIYRFRGAKPEIMMNFKEDFKNCKIIMMSTNYRSAQKIVTISDMLIKDNKQRFAKDFISYRGQEEGIEGEYFYLPFEDKTSEMKSLVDNIQDAHRRGIPYKEMAVLFRTNKQAQVPMTHLKNAGIPFNSTERVKSIYEDWLFAIIKSYVMLSFGKGTKSDLLAVLNKPNRYFKYQAFQNVEFTYKGMMDAIAPLKDTTGGDWRYHQAQKEILSWLATFGPGVLKPQDPPKKVFNGLKTLKIENHIKEYAKVRKVDIAEFMSVYDELMKDAAKFETIYDWFRFGEAQVRASKELNQKDAEGVNMTTMHKSKGKEWRVVFVIDVNTSIVPHRNSSETIEGFEEERRLLYVAMTRAKDELYVMCSGVESIFMKDLMRVYRKKMSTTKYKKPTLGSLMMHKKFGMGIVTHVTDERITLDFAGAEKMFVYPDAIEQRILRVL